MELGFSRTATVCEEKVAWLDQPLDQIQYLEISLKTPRKLNSTFMEASNLRVDSDPNHILVCATKKRKHNPIPTL